MNARRNRAHMELDRDGRAEASRLLQENVDAAATNPSIGARVMLYVRLDRAEALLLRGERDAARAALAAVRPDLESLPPVHGERDRHARLSADVDADR